MAMLDVIDFPNEQRDEIVARIPAKGPGAINLGSQLVVREGQRAIFVREGKALDVLGPGRHTLSTALLPILANILGLSFGGKTPFSAEVFFVSTRDFINMKWGTPQPLTFRDADFGMVRLRAFGMYSMRVEDPNLFVARIVGVRGSYTTNDINDYLKSIIVTEFNTLLGKTNTPLLDLPALTSDLAKAARLTLGTEFQRIGLYLSSFQINAITPPEEVQKRIDERSGMAALGSMNTYTQFQAAQALRDAAQNTSGGIVSTGTALGAGVALGNSMAGALNPVLHPSPDIVQRHPPTDANVTVRSVPLTMTPASAIIDIIERLKYLRDQHLIDQVEFEHLKSVFVSKI